VGSGLVGFFGFEGLDKGICWEISREIRRKSFRFMRLP
jgi:hypothetical protein